MQTNDILFPPWTPLRGDRSTATQLDAHKYHIRDSMKDNDEWKKKSFPAHEHNISGNEAWCSLEHVPHDIRVYENAKGIFKYLAHVVIKI